MTGANLKSNDAKITVIFLLYSEAKYVAGLFKSILSQRHPAGLPQSEWLEVMFVDNGSKDDTLAVIQAEMKRVGSPPNYHIVAIPQNIGIAGALNHAFGKVTTPFALTCHCDCLFGRDDYVAAMREQLERHPDAGAIAGQPAIPKKERIPFAEKVNLIVNLMDIFPAKPGAEHTLVPVGFVEGRCDGFRLSALRAVGFYDTTLKLAGEDQVLAAKMRQAGFQIYQAPDLPYMLSVSSDQDSLSKLARHQRLFGRAHPYIVLKNRKAVAGISGKSAGANRQSRSLLRVIQVLSAAGYLAAIVALALFIATLIPAYLITAAVTLLLIFIMKQALFGRHMRTVRLTAREWLMFYANQPRLDISYTLGLINGVWLVFFRSEAKPIT